MSKNGSGTMILSGNNPLPR
ncbi:MAG: hypothetical protein ACLP9L_19420 [Thermoguttaceae bacterium]